MFPQIVEEELEITIMDEKTKDPVVYVSGDSVGMPALGTGFIQGSTLNSLKNILTVQKIPPEQQASPLHRTGHRHNCRLLPGKKTY